MEHFYQDIDGWFDYEELYKEVVGRMPWLSHPNFVAEVGCYKGKATAFLLTELVNAGRAFQLICVDGWDSPDLQDSLDFPVP